jgi:membrane protein DedA with SNARE-associated domain
MDSLEIFNFLKNYVPLIALLSAPLGGGIVVVALSSVYFNNLYLLVLIYFLSLFSFTFFDSLLFIFGKYIHILNFSKNRSKPFFKRLDSYSNIIYEKTLKSNYFTTIFYSKLLYGLAIPTMLLVGRKEKNYFKFFILDLIVNLILISFFVGIGIGLGSGLNFIVRLSENRSFLLLTIFLSIILIFSLEKIFKKLFFKQ